MAIDVKITDNSDEFLNALPEQIEQALTAIGLTAESYAKEAITSQKAVDTGRLRNSITYATRDYSGVGTYSDNNGQSYSDATANGKPEENTVYIGTNVEYAAFVELGTSRMGARPYLKPAATEHTTEYKGLAEQALKGG